MKRLMLALTVLACALAQGQTTPQYHKMGFDSLWVKWAAGGTWVRNDSYLGVPKYYVDSMAGATAGAYDDSAVFRNARLADSLKQLYAENARFWNYLMLFRGDTSSADALPAFPGEGGGFVYGVKKSALAAGYRSAALWSDTAFGVHSFAYGVNNYAKDSAVALGIRAMATGVASAAVGGWGNTASGAAAATIGGAGLTAEGDASFIGGGGSAIEPSIVTGNHSAIVGGKGLTVTGTMSVGFGHAASGDTLAADSFVAFVNQRVGIDTTDGPASLNVADNAWVGETTFSKFLYIDHGALDRGIKIRRTANPELQTLIQADKVTCIDTTNTSRYVDIQMSSSPMVIVGQDSARATMGCQANTATIVLLGGGAGTWACTTVVDTNHFRNNGAIESPYITATGAAGFVGVGAVVPGQIIDWYGDSSAFPTGYVLCDGTRKFKNAAGDSVVTPDLRNFFTVGASIDTGNGIPMSTIEDTTGTTAKPTGGSVKYTPEGAVSMLSAHNTSTTVDAGGGDAVVNSEDATHDTQNFTGTRAVLVQPYVAVWKLVRSRTW